jgi:hypothetical protein
MTVPSERITDLMSRRGDKMGAQILELICPLFYKLNDTFA